MNILFNRRLVYMGFEEVKNKIEADVKSMSDNELYLLQDTREGQPATSTHPSIRKFMEKVQRLMDRAARGVTALDADSEAKLTSFRQSGCRLRTARGKTIHSDRTFARPRKRAAFARQVRWAHKHLVHRLGHVDEARRGHRRPFASTMRVEIEADRADNRAGRLREAPRTPEPAAATGATARRHNDRVRRNWRACF